MSQSYPENKVTTSKTVTMSEDKIIWHRDQDARSTTTPGVHPPSQGTLGNNRGGMTTTGVKIQPLRETHRTRVIPMTMNPRFLSFSIIISSGFHHIALVCKNMTETIKFYEGALGMKLRAVYPMHGIKGAKHCFLEVVCHIFTWSVTTTSPTIYF